jgi:hypothetical protein
MTDAVGPGEEKVKGTLIYGADGAVYFVPDEDLAAFRVEESVAEPIRGDLSELAAIREFGDLGDEADLPLSIHGAIGRRPQGLSNTILHVDPVAFRPFSPPDKRPGP